MRFHLIISYNISVNFIFKKRRLAISKLGKKKKTITTNTVVMIWGDG